METENAIAYIKEAIETADPYVVQQICEYLMENEQEQDYV
jgi:hypothetical protein